MLVKLSIEEFSRVLGSNAPAPGGGSVAALSGALGADLDRVPLTPAPPFVTQTDPPPSKWSTLMYGFRA